MNMQTASPKLDPSAVGLRLGMCALALAGTAGVVTDASAVVVTNSTPIPVPNNFDGIYLNLLTGGFATSGAGSPGWDLNPYNSGTGLSFFWSATPSAAGGVAGATTGPYLDLAAGSVISAASTFSAVTATAQTAAFKTVGTHTLGFRFYNETAAAVNYGFMTLDVGGTTGFPLTILGWSFENSGGPITVSAVPEPASSLMLTMGALALGAAHLRRVRRQRREQAA